MMRPSTLTTALFVLIVLAVAVLWVYAVRKTSAPGRAPWLLVSLAPLLVCLGIPGVLAQLGLLDRYAPLPAPALLLVGLISIGTAGLAFSPLGTRLATGLPLAGLVG